MVGRASGCSRCSCIGEPRSEWWTSSTSAPGLAAMPSAIRSASRTRSVRMWPASCQPTIIAAVGVEHEREEDEPLPAAQVGEVGDPELVRAAGGEVALDQIRPALRLRVGPGRAPRLAAPLGTVDPVASSSAAAPGSAAPARRRDGAPSTSAGSRRRSSWPRAARGSGRAAARPRRLDAERRPLAPLVVGGRRHAQGPADRLDPEAAAMLVDVAAHFGRSGSSSLAKNTDADFRISFARRSSKFSWRSRLISSRSSLVGRSGRRP